MSLTLDDLKARERQEVTFTMECSGNSGLPFFIGGVGNAAWAGAPLAALLEEAGVREGGVEVVFWGADAGEQVWREMTITERFARGMSLSDAMRPDTLLAYEMNGEALPAPHGFPLLGLLGVRLGRARPRRARHHLARYRRGRRGAAGAGRPAPGRQGDVLGEQRPDHTADRDFLVRVVEADSPPWSS